MSDLPRTSLSREVFPSRIAEVVALAAQGESFDFFVRDFLGCFYPRLAADVLWPEPKRFANQLPQLGAVEDAYPVATAEWLAWKFNLPPPRRAFDQARSLRRPWFAASLSSLRGVLLFKSPAPFRSRNLFVGENARSRA